MGEFYSVAFTKGKQQADTGTKMIHLGKNTSSTIISKGISAGKSQNSYRGLVKVNAKAENARNFSQCDSMLLGDKCGAHTFPYLEIENNSAQVEHEATTSKVGEDQIFYCNQRGIGEEEAIKLIVNGFCKDILAKLPYGICRRSPKITGHRARRQRWIIFGSGLGVHRSGFVAGNNLEHRTHHSEPIPESP